MKDHHISIENISQSLFLNRKGENMNTIACLGWLVA